MSGKQCGEGRGRRGDYTDGIVSTKSAVTSSDFLYTGTYSWDLWSLVGSGYKYGFISYYEKGHHEREIQKYRVHTHTDLIF